MTGSTFTEKFIEKQLKLYHLNPNDYGQEWFTIAYDKVDAFAKIVENIRVRSEKQIKHQNELGFDTKYTEGEYNLWLKVDPWDSKTFPMKYSLDEYQYGEVIQSEIA